MSKCANCGELISIRNSDCPRCGAKNATALDKDFTKRLRIAGLPKIADTIEALQDELEQVTKERDALRAKLENSGHPTTDVSGMFMNCKKLESLPETSKAKE